jgi:hypothetical protein
MPILCLCNPQSLDLGKFFGRVDFARKLNRVEMGRDIDLFGGLVSLFYSAFRTIEALLQASITLLRPFARGWQTLSWKSVQINPHINNGHMKLIPSACPCDIDNISRSLASRACASLVTALHLTAAVK